MNNTFKILYGMNPSEIRSTVIIMPFDIPQAAKGLAVNPWIKGKLFASAQGNNFTLIRSGMSAGFVGDCVLRLKDTPCEKIIFLGTAGLIKQENNLNIGSIVTPTRVYAVESFCEILSGSIKPPHPINADNTLIPPAILRVQCVSFASMHEETKHLDLFSQLGVNIIEMECAAFFSAAANIQRPSSAILVISDILGNPNLCFNLPKEDEERFKAGIMNACQIITQNI